MRDAVKAQPHPTLPAGYRAGAATLDDLSHVSAMMRAADLADVGEIDFTEQMLRDDWRIPELDLGSDTWMITGRGEVAAYGWLLARDEHRQLDGWGVVHPGHRGRGLGTYLVLRAEERAADHASAVPDGDEVILRSGVVGKDIEGHRLLERHGYRLVRSGWRMSTDLPDEVRLSSPLAPVIIRSFREGDERLVHETFEDSFSEHFGHAPRTFEDWAAHRLAPGAFDPELWFVAVDGDQVVGALAGSVDAGAGVVETLGVRAPWRRKGVGEALLRRSFAAFAARGLQRVTLFVDSENQTGATRLYERVGMWVHRRYDTFEKRIPSTRARSVTSR
jgi:mycothiol synthase